MDFFEVVRTRHSYREEFHDRKIPREALIKIVQAGIQAPSAHNSQTTEFVIVDDAILLKELSELIPQKNVRTAQAVIFCIAPKAFTIGGIDFSVQNFSVAIENMLLAITALGYASVWTDQPFLTQHKDVEVANFLRIPDDRQLVVMLPIGAALRARDQREKKPFQELAWFNRYGG